MILVLAGTADGRELAKKAQDAGYPVLVSTATQYGSLLAKDTPVRCGALDETGFLQVFSQHLISLVVDATHPYAVNVSETAMAACRRAGVKYIRFERPRISLPDNELLHQADTFLAAAQLAAQLGRRIFLTVGSNHLGIFAQTINRREKCLIARVLPTPGVVQKCVELGFKPSEIVAMQGPFGLELNKAMLKHYAADVVVTKESGEQGGAAAKLQAALELNIPVVLVTRPQLNYPLTVTDWAGLERNLQAFDEK
ncbi:MAG TPA: precorrin-6A reductase [Desulfobacteria bacterium]|nr:precorrin-6A reductase [Desulfobacteria bacterium]